MILLERVAATITRTHMHMHAGESDACLHLHVRRSLHSCIGAHACACDDVFSAHVLTPFSAHVLTARVSALPAPPHPDATHQLTKHQGNNNISQHRAFAGHLDAGKYDLMPLQRHHTLHCIPTHPHHLGSQPIAPPFKDLVLVCTSRRLLACARGPCFNTLPRVLVVRTSYAVC